MMSQAEGTTQTNEMEITFDSRSENEGFARVAVAAFLTQLDPLLEEISDVKTAVSEAVTNAVIHGYGGGEGKIRLSCRLEKEGRKIYIEVEDKGVGIEDVEKAREPMFTTRSELDRSGMGFAFMEAFMNEVEVESAPGKGTCVRMYKRFEEGSRISFEHTLMSKIHTLQCDTDNKEGTWTTQSL